MAALMASVRALSLSTSVVLSFWALAVATTASIAAISEAPRTALRASTMLSALAIAASRAGLAAAVSIAIYSLVSSAVRASNCHLPFWSTFLLQ